MSHPLPINFELLERLRAEKGTHAAIRQARRDTIKAELNKPNPDIPAVIMTLLKLI